MVFPVFWLLTYEFCLSLWKIARCSVILLLPLCAIYIANGKLSNDKNIGKTTCKDASLVDYLLLSSSMFNEICELDVTDNNPMFSDAHSRLHFSIIAAPPIQNNGNNKNTITYINGTPIKQIISHVHLLSPRQGSCEGI